MIRIASVSLYLCRSVSLPLFSLYLSPLSLSLFFSFSLSIYLSTNKKFPSAEGSAHFLLDIDFYMYRRYLVEAVDVRVRKTTLKRYKKINLHVPLIVVRWIENFYYSMFCYLVEAVDVRVRQLRNFRLSQSSNVSMSGQLPRFEFVFRVFQDVREG